MYPEEIKERVIELNRDHSAAQVYKQLLKEYSDVEVPDESTVREWINDAGSEALNERRQVFVEEQREAHFTHMADMADMLLARGVGGVMNVPDPNDTYTLCRDGAWDDLTETELVARIGDNIDNICSILTTWEFFDCFVKHLEAENEEIKKDFYKFLNDKPLELINIVRTLAQGKIFKGKCPICEEW